MNPFRLSETRRRRRNDTRRPQGSPHREIPGSPLAGAPPDSSRLCPAVLDESDAPPHQKSLAKSYMAAAPTRLLLLSSPSPTQPKPRQRSRTIHHRAFSITPTQTPSRICRRPSLSCERLLRGVPDISRHVPQSSSSRRLVQQSIRPRRGLTQAFAVPSPSLQGRRAPGNPLSHSKAPTLKSSKSQQ